LSGCASQRYKVDYGGFQDAYAANSNRQMLLNLARLDQHEPTYFLQFGQISVQYNWTSSLTGAFSNAIPSQATSHIPVFGETGSIAGGASTNPSFTFIPVTDEKVAQQLLQPVDPEVLYALFQQGCPVDQLMRLMVDRVEITDNNGATRVDFNTPGSPGYALFLNACAVARELQKQGYLILRADKVFSPAADGVEQDNAPTVEQVISLEKGGGSAGGGGSSSDSGNTSSGGGKGGGADAGPKLVWNKMPDNKWTVGSYDLTPVFKYNGPVDAQGNAPIYENLANKSDYVSQAVNNMRAILTKGFSVQAKPTTDKAGNPGTHLILRSFLGILAASAQEEASFNRWAAANPNDFKRIPLIDRQPILRLKWDRNANLLNPVVDLDYRSQYYQITDPKTVDLDEKASWNLDVFRLLIQLSTQVSIDISKYPLPTTLQVTP
jgi:uncharacterized membrane protein YgcG